MYGNELADEQIERIRGAVNKGDCKLIFTYPDLFAY